MMRGIVLSIDTILMMTVLITAVFIYSYALANMVKIVNESVTLSLNYATLYRALSYFSSIYRGGTTASFIVDREIFYITSGVERANISLPIVQENYIMVQVSRVPAIVPILKPTKYENYMILPFAVDDGEHPGNPYIPLEKVKKLALQTSTTIVLPS